MARRRELGAVLAVGNTSTIRAWGPDQVVKVMLPGTPARWADMEAEWTAQLHAAGLPVPEVFGVTEVEGQRAIVSQRILGPTMLASMVSTPSTAAVHARELAQLQVRFHDQPAPPGLPELSRRLATKIRDADLPPSVREPALDQLARLPDGQRLCHGDLHPGNVIRDRGGAPVVVDWFDVTVGSPAADVARTSLLVRPRRSLGPPGYLPGATNRLLDDFHRAYLDAYEDLTGLGREAVADWELPVAAARMCEQVEHDPADLAGLV